MKIKTLENFLKIAKFENFLKISKFWKFSEIAKFWKFENFMKIAKCWKFSKNPKILKQFWKSHNFENFPKIAKLSESPKNLKKFLKIAKLHHKKHRDASSYIQTTVLWRLTLIEIGAPCASFGHFEACRTTERFSRKNCRIHFKCNTFAIWRVFGNNIRHIHSLWQVWHLTKTGVVWNCMIHIVRNSGIIDTQQTRTIYGLKI